MYRPTAARCVLRTAGEKIGSGEGEISSSIERERERGMAGVLIRATVALLRSLGHTNAEVCGYYARWMGCEVRTIALSSPPRFLGPIVRNL